MEKRRSEKEKSNKIAHILSWHSYLSLELEFFTT